MVTNCIVRATRINSNPNSKKRNLILIDTSKESNFYANLKYTCFVYNSLNITVHGNEL
jgi:hypothetical protein